MKMKWMVVMSGVAFCASVAFAQDVVSAVDGTVKKIDAGSKTVVVKSADGTEHTFHYADNVAVHGGDDVATGSKDTLHGLKEGSQVAVHYSERGGKDTAVEFDKIGDDGMKATKGTVSHVDMAAKKISVKTADGTEETFRLTGDAAKDTGKDVVAGTDKSVHVTVYYTEKAGQKTAHFIKEAF